MRRILAAAALTTAIVMPAKAQYTITISGTGTYASPPGDPTGVLGLYGSTIDFSSTIYLDKLTYYPAPDFPNDRYYEYAGQTLSTSINSTALPNLFPSPEAILSLSSNPSEAGGQLYVTNGKPIIPLPGTVLLINGFTLPGLNGPALPSDMVSYLSASSYSYILIAGSNAGAAGMAAYNFTATSFVISGTRPLLVALGVPEPAEWAMVIAGFALAGGAMRRRVRVRYA